MEAKKTELLDLPVECLSQILSYTTPVYVLHCSRVCKLLYSIASSDIVWEKLVPVDLQPLIQRSATFPSKKYLVFLLCTSAIFLENGHMTFTLDKWTGKKSYMLGARRLIFASGDMFGCWRGRLPQPYNSWFVEVAELIGVSELHITGRINTQLLSPNTTYRMYFSFTLKTYSQGFDFHPIRVFVSKIDANGAYLESNGDYDTSKTFYLKAPSNSNKNNNEFDDLEVEDTAEHVNAPNWINIDMGKYFNGGKNGDVAMLEMTLMGTEIGLHKSGLVVHGIEILPVD